MTAPLLLHQVYLQAAATMLFATLLIVACITRALVLLRRSELTLTELNGTVSLLLGEFENSGSDWLWETDAQWRVVRASARFAASVGLSRERLDGMPLFQALAGPAWDTSTAPTACACWRRS